jgi:hypothetical protein
MSIMGRLHIVFVISVWGQGSAEFGVHEPETAGKGTCRLTGTTLVRVRAL